MKVFIVALAILSITAVADAKKVEGFEKIDGKYVRVVTEEVSENYMLSRRALLVQMVAENQRVIAECNEEISYIDNMVQ